MSVEIREEILTIPTYAWGADDPNPPFGRSGTWSIYPYTLLDDIGEQKQPRDYRALVVENEYLRVTVLPELGGRIYSAVDKPTGREMFYRNNVVKPGLIALRGAWISGGVEFNFPRGHTVTTISQVDGRAEREEDGSAVVWVGNIERIYRMSWAVGIRLRPGSAAIETEVRLANRGSLPHPYYFWQNAAIAARDDMRMVYPGTRVRTWGPPRRWPIHEGKDIARYTAYERSNDVFIVDSLEDFFGVYYEEQDCGLVHVANVHECYGKKFFTWGTSDHGKVWSEALSDGDGPYCEIQSGRFVDQGTWRLMPPHHSERWLEWWYPVRGTGGFSRANREAAVQVTGRNGRVECGVAVTRAFPGSTVRVTVEGRTVHEARVDLAPDQPFRLELRREKDWPSGPPKLELLGAGGREIISYTEGQAPRTIEVSESKPAAAEKGEQSPGELMRDALHAEERAEPERARELYGRALELDPGCVQASLARGRVTLEWNPSEAVEHLKKTTAQAPDSAEAAYYLGVALARSGRREEAETELWRAAHRPEVAHAARVELGALALQRGDWEQAIEVLRSSLDYSAADVRARCLLAAALRHGGRVKEAMAEIAAVRAGSPLDRLAAAEAHFCAAALGRPRVAARHLNELGAMTPPESDVWLEPALDYAGAGLIEEAVTLLQQAMKRTSSIRTDPLTHYALACWLDVLGRGKEAAEARGRASRLSPRLVFPHHWEFEVMLREAIARSPEDGQARCLLGTLLYSQGRRSEGLAEWEAAASTVTDLAVLYRNLGLAHRVVTGDLEQAEQGLRRALKLDPAQMRVYLELNELLRERGAPAQERLAVLDSAPESLQRRGATAAQQATVCMELGDWDRAIHLLKTHTFHRWEMEFRMRHVYVDAYLGRGVERFDGGDFEGACEDFEAALEYPRNVRIGRMPHTQDARACWCAGNARRAMGDGEAARRHWESAAAETHHQPGSELLVYRALSLRELGNAEEAEKLLAESLAVAEQCADMEQEDPNTQFCLGLTRKALGKAQEASEAFRRALELAPSHRRSRRLLETDVIL